MSTLAHLFFTQAAERGDHCAIACEGARLTYAELATRTARLSHGLRGAGVRPGDCIGVLASNTLDFATLLLAAADCGALLCPVSPTLPADAALRAFAAADVRHVFAEDSTRLAELRTRHGGDGAWLDSAALTALLDAAPANTAPALLGELDTPFVLSTTSGSTGDPKAVVLTQRAKIERAAAAVALYGVTANDRVLAATPLYHSLAQRLLFTSLLHGATFVLMPRYAPLPWMALVEGEGVTFTIAASSQLAQVARVLRTAPSSEERFRTLRAVVSSSAPLAASDKDIILGAFGCDFHECYGASEIAIATSLNLTTRDAPLDSVGTPAPNVEVRILSDAGAPLPHGEIGEIAVRTPMAFAGYHKRSYLTAAAMANGFFKTGDLGRIDASGALYYLGRTKELIITGGVNVYPADVEAVIASVPGVGECAAFAAPDERSGEVVALAVAPTHPGAVSVRALRRICVERLAEYQRPQRIILIDALPRNAMGKLARRDLPALLETSQEAAI